MSPLRDVVIVSAVRTPIGRLNGGLASVRPDDLAALVIAEAVKRAGVEGKELEEVVFGCANQAGEDNRNVARMATLLAGLPNTVPAFTVNRLCASGLAAINQAARAIRAGEGDVYVAGGVESMTRAPYSLPKNSPGGNVTAYDTALGWRYPNPKLAALFPLEAMGETAENIAERTGITREDQDKFALQSQTRAVAAMNEGRFAEEIVPVPIAGKKGATDFFSVDEHPRAEKKGETYEVATDLAQLGKLKAAFRTGGTVTAGNSSGLNDGAAALVLMSRERAKSLGLEPLATWRASAAHGIDPRVMGLGPVDATRKALSRAGLTLKDLGLAELNEAFAVQALGVLRALGLSEEISNVNGGAIALGHPLGCSGARIVTTLVHEMKRRQVTHGLATLCVGVGQGEATILTRE
ncbi:MAG: 3-oxoadipyl-CoA thiolase [Archangium gephyra]|uniref:acetyl-CoA C-acyltransferase n=1 Tax=Archangium gephyra TaxID=48 RepID=A0A2W5VDC5_9BACT|nr:MAG: 3-oxoadipyl-CoA thiolase [Archangium gephyra]